MIQSLIQFIDASGPAVAALDADGAAFQVRSVRTVYELAWRALTGGISLADLLERIGLGVGVDVEELQVQGRLLAPIQHQEPARLYLTGTGLTHRGSAMERDIMHRQESGKTEMTDSMKLFLLGRDGGKPEHGGPGVQPEWFYKGNGACLVPPGGKLESPAFGRDAGEEPEIAGVYMIGPAAQPIRLGFCLANEFSDHVMERENYLWLSHSKLRPCSIGPELRLGPLPANVRGTSRIRRGDQVLWEKAFQTGEDNMVHSLANLEYHHFKYSIFRRPGDVHVHFLGTSALSFADGIVALPGDVFEVSADAFPLPLRNRVAEAADEEVRVTSL